MSNYDSLGDRMKQYEDCWRLKLPRRCPKVIRIDGKAFHTFLRNAEKPFDVSVMQCMNYAAQYLIKEIGGVARFAYIQSDECSIVLNDHLDLETQPWFDNNIQKMVSVSSSVFGYYFNNAYSSVAACGPAYFDARVFMLPYEDELINYLIWRQQDASRNSINLYARSMFSHAQLQGKSCAEMQDMMMNRTPPFNWNDAITWTKRGAIAVKDRYHLEIPIFTADRNYITKLYEAGPVQP